MKDHTTVELEAPPSKGEPEETPGAAPKPTGPCSLLHSLSQRLIRDWQTHKTFFFGTLLLLLTIIVTLLHYGCGENPKVLQEGRGIPCTTRCALHFMSIALSSFH